MTLLLNLSDRITVIYQILMVYEDDSLNIQMDPGEATIKGVSGLYVLTYTIGQVAAPIPGANGIATVDDLAPTDFPLFVMESQLATITDTSGRDYQLRKGRWRHRKL